jgi:hypothetical protein
MANGRGTTKLSVRWALVLLMAVPASVYAQVQISGGVVLVGSGAGACPNCALLPAANLFTALNSFPAIEVAGTVNGLPLVEDNLSNIGFGNQSITPGTGSQNIGLGDFTLAGASGQGNVGVGYNALDSVAAGGSNVGIGQQAAPQITSGNNNVAIGRLALSDITSQSANVAIGAEAGSGPSAPGQFPTLSNSIYIGYQAAPASAGTYTNQIVIGYGAQGTASNQTTIGNTSTTGLVLYGVPTFPSLAGAGSGCVGISNTGLTSVVSCGSGGGGSAFSALTSGTNTAASMFVGTGASLGAVGSGTIAATSATTATTAGALAGTPSLCSSGQAPTGIMPNGNATGCQAVGGGGNVTSSTLTAGTFPVATGASAIGNSSALSQSGATLTWAPGAGSSITGTGTASNTDGVGELVISSTTASYTFVNTYASHPECYAQSQFLAAAPPSVTYTGTTAFTITYASSSYSGDKVSYHCDMRN